MLILAMLQPAMAAESRDSVVVSLLTCWPGAEVYELCGHEAIRVKGPGVDSVWNYGTFDFAQPNFIYRFVKGETDYMVAAYPTPLFMAEYRMNQRHVVEQELNLTAEEARTVHEMLRTNALPQNRTYRYNYVKDNCATRITAILDEATTRRIVYPDSVKYGTFRDEMRAYHRGYPWYQFGIDMALGSGIDYPLRGREEMFVPVEMMEKSAGAHFADGEPFVRDTRVLNDGVADAADRESPWHTHPLVISWIWFAAMALLCAVMLRKHKLYPIWYTLWFTLLGLAGCLIAFLVFVSTHEATSPNILLLWLNPLQLVIAVCVWLRGAGRLPGVAMAYTDVIVLTVMLIVWPMQAQSANPAFFPLMGTTLIMAATYAIIGTKSSYNKDKLSRNRRTDEEVSGYGSGRAGRDERRGTNPGRKATSGGRRGR